MLFMGLRLCATKRKYLFLLQGQLVTHALYKSIRLFSCALRIPTWRGVVVAGDAFNTYCLSPHVKTCLTKINYPSSRSIVMGHLCPAHTIFITFQEIPCRIFMFPLYMSQLQKVKLIDTIVLLLISQFLILNKLNLNRYH